MMNEVNSIAMAFAGLLKSALADKTIVMIHHVFTRDGKPWHWITHNSEPGTVFHDVVLNKALLEENEEEVQKLIEYLEEYNAVKVG